MEKGLGGIWLQYKATLSILHKIKTTTMTLFKITYYLTKELKILLEEDRETSFLIFAQQIKNIQIGDVLYCVTKTCFLPESNELFIHLQEF